MGEEGASLLALGRVSVRPRVCVLGIISVELGSL
jgi:hypothetical protein